MTWLFLHCSQQDPIIRINNLKLLLIPKFQNIESSFCHFNLILSKLKLSYLVYMTRKSIRLIKWKPLKAWRDQKSLKLFRLSANSQSNSVQCQIANLTRLILKQL